MDEKKWTALEAHSYVKACASYNSKRVWLLRLNRLKYYKILFVYKRMTWYSDCITVCKQGFFKQIDFFTFNIIWLKATTQLTHCIFYQFLVDKKPTPSTQSASNALWRDFKTPRLVSRRNNILSSNAKFVRKFTSLCFNPQVEKQTFPHRMLRKSITENSSLAYILRKMCLFKSSLCCYNLLLHLQITLTKFT